MPLVRFELKNEYGLGDPRLYQGASKEEEDPRNILGGVTVSGLVGILRQLGDLSELAAVVFHDVHQQVMTTAARGQKVLNRIQEIEATLPQFEKAVQEQKSHIHFAYIAGCDWHANIQTSPCRLFSSDLPEFMSDSYEECRDPPRLHFLDKFDSAGAGACLKRYSDPFYFRMLMASSDSVMAGKENNGMKVQRKKKQRSRGNGLAHHFINKARPGRSLNRGMQFASLAKNDVNFSVDDASVSDTLSISGFTTEFPKFNSDKRSGCLEVQNPPSSLSKELYDDMPTTDAETAQEVECIFNNGNKVTASDYVIQDSLHQRSNLLSSSISCAEKTEMVMSVSQMQSHDIPEDGLNPKAAGLSNSLSNRNHLTDSTGTHGEHISRSLTWDESATDSLGAWVKTVYSLSSFVSKENATGNSEILEKSIYGTYSAASDEKAVTKESASSKFSDGIIPYRPPDSDFLFETLETSNQQSEMDDTEMHNLENVLPDTIKMAVPSTAVSLLTNQLDNYMNVTKALNYHTGKEVILLPHQNHNGMNCEIRSLKVTIPSLDGIDNEIAHDPCASLKKSFSLQVIFDHLQSSGSAESASRLIFAVENAVSESPPCDNTVKDDSQRINSASWLGVIVPTAEDVDFDKIQPEDCSSQDFFGDSYAKTVCETERRYLLKQEMELTTDSNCLGTESQSRMEKVIAASKSDCLNPEINACFSCSSCPGSIIPSTQDVAIDGVPPEESLSHYYFGGVSAKTACKKELLCEHQTEQETESTDNSSCHGNEYESNMEKGIEASKLDDSDSVTHVASLNSATCPGFIFANAQAVIIDGIPPESLSQDSFGDASVKTASEKVVLCEHQTKQGTESMTDLNCEGTEYRIIMEKVIAASNFDGTNFKSHVAFCGSPDAYASPILCGLIISDSLDNTSSPTFSSDVTLSGTPISIVSPRNVFEEHHGNILSKSTNKSMIIPSDVTAATPVVSQGFPEDSFRKSSINIWTNGGILGLEPSKPSDISVPNAYGSNDICDGRPAANSQSRVLCSGNESRKLFFEADNLNQISSPEQDNILDKISDEQSDSVLSKQCPKGSIQASSYCEIGKDQNAYFCGTASEIDGVQGKIGGAISSEPYTYSKTVPESTVSGLNIGMPVGFSSLAHRFLVSSLQRKFSMNGITPLSELMNNDVHKLRGTKIHSKDKERPKLAISSASLHKHGNKEDFSHGFSENLVSSSLDPSGYHSPPLEHMKISFQQTNDSDVSKLNLEFFSSQHQGNMTFPSFQLRTESFQPLLDGVSESDDDTFCKSSPYSSDDLLTLHSGSDTEIWGDDDIHIL